MFPLRVMKKGKRKEGKKRCHTRGDIDLEFFFFPSTLASWLGACFDTILANRRLRMCAFGGALLGPLCTQILP